MTDMRATERLLEVIQEQTSALLRISEEDAPIPRPMARDLNDAIAELRRRGDTVVRRDDLQEVFDHADGWLYERYGDKWRKSTNDRYMATSAVWDRIEIALGGKMR